jgi:hypothetical protein
MSEDFTIYNLLNIPNKMTKDGLTELLQLKQGDFTRVYKQSLYWILVSENVEFNLTAEKNLKSLKIDDANLRYDITSSKMVKRSILKKIQHHNYMKETDDLKANSSPNGGSNYRRDSKNYNEKKGSISGNIEKSTNAGSGDGFSWRKKSDVSTNSREE